MKLKPTGPKLVTLKELCEALGVTRRQVRRMVAAGFPTAGKHQPEGGGRPAYLYDIEAVRIWMAQNVRLNPVAAAGIAAGKSARAKAIEEVKQFPPAEASQSPDGQRTPTEKAALEDFSMTVGRARIAERMAFGAYVSAMKANDTAQAHLAQTNWQRTADTLRKMEADAGKIQKTRGEVIAVATHERIWNEGHAKVASELGQYPKRAASLIVMEVRKHKKNESAVRAVYALMTEDMRDVMRHLETQFSGSM